jgi:hypothetical protein
MSKNLKNDQTINNKKIEIEFALSKKIPVSLSHKLGVQLPLAAAKKLLTSYAVIAVPTGAYIKLKNILHPFISFLGTMRQSDHTNITLSFLSFAKAQTKEGLTDDQIQSTFRNFNRFFSMDSIAVLRQKYNQEYFQNINFYDDMFIKDMNSSYKPSIFKSFSSRSNFPHYLRMFHDILFDDNIVNQYPLFVRQFFNIILFLFEHYPFYTYLGFVGGTILVYNIASKWMKNKQQRIKDEREKDELKANVLSDFSRILNIIAQDYGLKHIFESENSKHMFVKYEYNIPLDLSLKETNEKLKQFKHFLQSTPPNIFIHHIAFNKINLIPLDKKTNIEDLDHIAKNVKKYTDVHIERYFYRYPSTVSQRIKRYMKKQPQFSLNVHNSQ